MGAALWRANSFAVLATGGRRSTLRDGGMVTFAVVVVPDIHDDRQVRTLFGAWRGTSAFAALGISPTAGKVVNPELWGYSKHLCGFA